MQPFRRDVQPGPGFPLLARPDADGGPERFHLARIHEAGMVVLVAREGQAVALDRVGDEAGRPVIVDGGEPFEHGSHVLPGKIGHEAVQLLVVMALQQAADSGEMAEVVLQRLSPGRPALVDEGRVAGVRAIVDPAFQSLAVPFPEGRLKAFPVFERVDLPSHRPENAVEAPEQAVGHDRVEALAVVVDDPPEIADIVLPAFEHRLEDIALVDLGIAHYGHHPSGRAAVPQPLQADIILHDGGECGDPHAEADRAGGEIDIVAVLGARGVALRAAEGAEALQLLARLPPEQILDGVINRACMGLHRHPVAQFQRVEIERREDRRDRSAGRLVPSNFQSVAALAEVVGIVDHPGRQPEHLALERFQGCQAIRVHASFQAPSGLVQSPPGGNAMTVTFKQLTPVFGAEVSGVDIAGGVSNSDFAEIARLFNDYSVLVFRGQQIDDGQQIEFSKRFGPLEGTVRSNVGAGSEIAVISNVDPETDAILPVEDWRNVYNSGNEMWHTDSSFKRVPATASLLSGREVPPEEGETEFATGRAAWDDLEDALKEELDGLVAIHDFSYSRGLIRADLVDEAQRSETPPVPQAVVRSNPANGRRNLYAGAHASHIRGRDIEESRAFLRGLTDRIVQERYTYTHRWRQGDLVMWDNRCCLHRGRPWNKGKYRRVMHRTTVAGIGPTAA